MVANIEHKGILDEIKVIYNNFLTRIYKQFKGSDADVTEAEIERVINSDGVAAAEVYLSDKMKQLETAIANGTVKQTLRGTILRNAKEGLSPQAKTKFLKEAATRITGITETTRDQIRIVAKEIVDSNGKLVDFQTALKERFKQELTQGKADTIARTEYRSAYTYGQNHAVEKLAEKGVVITRIWRTSGTNVRPSHDIDGEERGVGEVYSNGLLYPMDPTADLSETINCNCSLDIITEDKKK